MIPHLYILPGNLLSIGRDSPRALTTPSRFLTVRDHSLRKKWRRIVLTTEGVKGLVAQLKLHNEACKPDHYSVEHSWLLS